MTLFYTGQSEDDAYIYAGSTIDLTSVSIPLGNINSPPTKAGVRFINVTIPKNATILTAKVTFGAYDAQSGTVCNVIIYGQAADNPPTFSTYANFTGRPLTTALLTWPALTAWLSKTNYDSPDIKYIIQEIVNRSGWASGNAIVLFFNDNASGTNAHRNAKTYDNDPTTAPILTVTWSTGYALAAEGGSFSEAGQTSGLAAARKLPATESSYSLSGQATTPQAARKLPVTNGAFSLAGASIVPGATRKLPADATSYAFLGQALTLLLGRGIAGEPGSYSLTGPSAALGATRIIDAEGVTYTLLGEDANPTLGRHYILIAEPGLFGEPYSRIIVTIEGRIYKKMGKKYLRLQ